jgi:hypothetical protein
MKSPIVALAIALSPPLPALADLILVEDNRFIETNYEGEVTRLDSPGAPTWEASLRSFDPEHGLPLADHLSTFSASAISGTGTTSTILDAGTYQGATSAFDMSFRVDRPTLVSLTGEFPSIPGHIPADVLGADAGPLLFQEDSALIFTWPSKTTLNEPFSFQTTLLPGPTYRLFAEAALFEDVDTGAGTTIGHRFEFDLEVPELPTVALLPLALAAILRRRN